MGRNFFGLLFVICMTVAVVFALDDRAPQPECPSPTPGARNND